jgi:MFS family permease
VPAGRIVDRFGAQRMTVVGLVVLFTGEPVMGAVFALAPATTDITTCAV